MTNLARAARAQKWPPRPRAEKFLAPRRHLRPDLGQGPHFGRRKSERQHASCPRSFRATLIIPGNARAHEAFHRKRRLLGPRCASCCGICAKMHARPFRPVSGTTPRLLMIESPQLHRARQALLGLLPGASALPLPRRRPRRWRWRRQWRWRWRWRRQSRCRSPSPSPPPPARSILRILRDTSCVCSQDVLCLSQCHVVPCGWKAATPSPSPGASLAAIAIAIANIAIPR